MSSTYRIWAIGTMLALLCVVAIAHDAWAGIPEPGVTLYGKVFGREGELVTEGNLAWTYALTGIADPITVGTELRTIDGVDGIFSYTVHIPAQLSVPWLPVRADALLLETVPTTHYRSATYDGVALGFDAPAFVNISLADRGTVERVDLYLGRKVMGDIDGDDRISAVDVQTVINTALGLDVGGRAPLADVNGDGVVDAVDVQLLVNRLLGIVDHEPGKAAEDDLISVGEDASEDEIDGADAPAVEGAPVAGMFGLGLVASICAIGGLVASARKR